MSTVIVGGGGPRPNARVVSVVESDGTISGYEIRDGGLVLVKCDKHSHANVLLPLIQSGE